ncbi:MAG: hypothetical protein ACKVH8_04770 [Pirellulales bacterium]
MTEQPEDTPEAENQFHHYRGNDIPWYVRMIWIGFWVFAIAYAIQYLIPAVRIELFEIPK